MNSVARTLRKVLFGIVAISIGFAAGAEEPAPHPSAADLVEQSLDASGIEAAIVRFQEILAAREAYDIDGNAMVALGRRLQQGGDFAEAAAVFSMAAEAFPEVTWLHRRIAAAKFAAGDPSGSLESMARMNELEDQGSLDRFLAEDHAQLARNAAEVIRGHLLATGGEEAWRAVKTMEVKVGAHDSRGRFVRIVRQYKRPLKYRQQVEGSDSFTATDGERLWRVTDEGWKEIDDAGYMHMASIDGWFLDSEQAGVTYEMLGFEIFHDAPVYRLRRSFADGWQEELLFSADHGYLTEIYSDYPAGTPVMRSYASLWRYRESGGIRLPHVFIRNVGPLGPPHGVVVEEVSINLPLADSLFAPPPADDPTSD